MLKNVHRMIKFNYKDWLKPYTDINTKRRQYAKNSFEKYFNLMNNTAFGKTMENVRKCMNLNFCRIMSNENMVKILNFVIWIKAAALFR